MGPRVGRPSSRAFGTVPPKIQPGLRAVPHHPGAGVRRAWAHGREDRPPVPSALCPRSSSLASARSFTTLGGSQARLGPRAGRPSSRAFGERPEVQALGLVHLVLAAHTNKIVVGRSARCFIMAREDGPCPHQPARA